MTHEPIHPGETLREDLEALGMSAAELARRIEVPVKRITQILNGQRAVTGDTALRLGRFFGTSGEFWLNLQKLYELRSAEREYGTEIARLPSLATGSRLSADIKLWHPFSRRPEHAFRVYSERISGYVTAADRLLLADIARSDISPGLGEQEFRQAVRELLAAIPITRGILSTSEDKLLTRADTDPYFEALVTEDYGANEIWEAFVQWMSYFYDDMVMKQEVSEIALRRAQVLAGS